MKWVKDREKTCNKRQSSLNNTVYDKSISGNRGQNPPQSPCSHTHVSTLVCIHALKMLDNITIHLFFYHFIFHSRSPSHASMNRADNTNLSHNFLCLSYNIFEDIHICFSTFIISTLLPSTLFMPNCLNVQFPNSL